MFQTPEVEYHPLPPFLPDGARVLMLGSFPPPRARWSMEFFYPNPQNDMWRIVGLAFFGERDHFLEELSVGRSEKRRFDRERIAAFCAARGIAFGDTAHAVIRHAGNASDALLEVVEPLDLAALLERIPQCRHVATTGQKAADTLMGILGGGEAWRYSPSYCRSERDEVQALPQSAFRPPPVGGSVECAFAGRRLTVWRMPSSSRAYPLSIDKKADAYRRMFAAAGVL